MVIFFTLYGIGWLYTARKLFHRWRGAHVGRRDCLTHGGRNHRYSSCCYDKATPSDGEAAAEAMTAALVFPLVLLVCIVRYRPPTGERPWARRLRRLRRKPWLSHEEVKVIEIEAGVGDHAPMP